MLPEEPTAASAAPTPSGPGSAAHVAKAASKGVVSLVVFSAFINGVQLVSSLVLARAISPTQYGAFAVGATVVGFARFLGDCGAGSVLIQQPGREGGSRTQLGQAFTIQLVVAGVAAVLLILAAPFLRAAFHAPPETTWIVVVLAVTLLLEAPVVVPRVRLRREQRYQRLQVLSIVPALALYATQISGLLLGYGIAALVAAQVVVSVVSSVTLTVGGGGPVRPVRRGSWGLARRGMAYQGTLVVQSLFSIASLAVVGTQLDTAQLGLWTWCTVLATPLISIAQNMHGVVFPSLSRLNEDHGGRHNEAVETVARLQFLFVSVAVGLLCGLALPVIRLVFDPRWLAGTGAARAALLGVLPLVLATLVAAALESRGRADLRLRSMVISCVVGVLALVVLADRFGATGAAVGSYLLVPLVDVAILLRWTRVDLRRAVLNLVVLTGGTFAVAFVLAARVTDLGGLLGAAVAAGVFGVVLMPVVDRPSLRRAWRVLRSP